MKETLAPTIGHTETSWLTLLTAIPHAIQLARRSPIGEQLAPPSELVTGHPDLGDQPWLCYVSQMLREPWIVAYAPEFSKKCEIENQDEFAVHAIAGLIHSGMTVPARDGSVTFYGYHQSKDGGSLQLKKDANAAHIATVAVHVGMSVYKVVRLELPPENDIDSYIEQTDLLEQAIARELSNNENTCLASQLKDKPIQYVVDATGRSIELEKVLRECPSAVGGIGVNHDGTLVGWQHHGVTDGTCFLEHIGSVADYISSKSKKYATVESVDYKQPAMTFHGAEAYKLPSVHPDRSVWQIENMNEVSYYSLVIAILAALHETDPTVHHVISGPVTSGKIGKKEVEQKRASKLHRVEIAQFRSAELGSICGCLQDAMQCVRASGVTDLNKLQPKDLIKIVGAPLLSEFRTAIFTAKEQLHAEVDETRRKEAVQQDLIREFYDPAVPKWVSAFAQKFLLPKRIREALHGEVTVTKIGMEQLQSKLQILIDTILPKYGGTAVISEVEELKEDGMERIYHLLSMRGGDGTKLLEKVISYVTLISKLSAAQLVDRFPEDEEDRPIFVQTVFQAEAG